MENNHNYLRPPRLDSQEGKSGNWLAWLNLFGFLIMVTVNYLANALPLNHLNTGQLSDKYPNLFVRPGSLFLSGDNLSGTGDFCFLFSLPGFDEKNSLPRLSATWSFVLFNLPSQCRLDICLAL